MFGSFAHREVHSFPINDDRKHFHLQRALGQHGKGYLITATVKLRVATYILHVQA